MKKRILFLFLVVTTSILLGGCIFPGDRDHHDDYDHHDHDDHDDRR